MRRRLPDQRREVRSKSDAAIERETAFKWAGRAVACYEEYAATGDVDWLRRGDDYRHEALEHAGTIGDRGATVRVIQDQIDGASRSLGVSVGKRVVSRKRRRSRRRRAL